MYIKNGYIHYFGAETININPILIVIEILNSEVLIKSPKRIPTVYEILTSDKSYSYKGHEGNKICNIHFFTSHIYIM